jgi:hypothetical protein
MDGKGPTMRVLRPKTKPHAPPERLNQSRPDSADLTPVMRLFVIALRLLLVGLVAAAQLGPGNAADPTIWFTPVEPFSLRNRNPSATTDLDQMVGSYDRWMNAAAHIKVLKVGTLFALASPDSMLADLLQQLKTKQIAFAIETSLLIKDGHCGDNVEGFTEPNLPERLAKKVKRLGGTIDYLAMDSELWFGHQYDRRNACHYTIEDIARRVAEQVSLIRQIFPDIRIGSIEPIGVVDLPDWPEKLERWLRAYKDAVGAPLSFFHLDVNWNGPWELQLRELVPYLKTNHIPRGVIYTGDPDDESGEAWTRHAEEKFVRMETDPWLIPDHAVMQSWLRQPTKNLPETVAGTTTFLVNRYITRRTKLIGERGGDLITGRLLGTDDMPLGEKILQIFSIDGKQSPEVKTISGRVPHDAVSATIGIRVNVECDCLGSADVAIGTMLYQDGERLQHAIVPPSEPLGGSDGRIRVPFGKRFSRNIAGFRVGPDSSYTLYVPMQASYGSLGSGHVAIIFLDAAGKGLRQSVLPFRSAPVLIGTSQTDASGRFTFLLQHNQDNNNNFLVKFQGDASDRMNWVQLRK